MCLRNKCACYLFDNKAALMIQRCEIPIHVIELKSYFECCFQIIATTACGLFVLCFLSFKSVRSEKKRETSKFKMP